MADLKAEPIDPASSEQRQRHTRSVLLSTRMLQGGKSAQLFGPGVCRRPYDTAAFLPGLGGGKRIFSQWLTADIVEKNVKPRPSASAVLPQRR